MSGARIYRWCYAEIADAIASGLARRAEAFEAEQAVHGLDSLDELSIHPMLHEALREAGFGVHCEQRYPRDRIKRKRSEGERCDIVLTPDARALLEPDVESTLFEPSDAACLSEAFWLEVKVVTQYTLEGANRSYGSDLGRPLHQDIAKLARDKGIASAGMVIVLFTSELAVAAHDLDVWANRGRRKGLPIGHPYRRTIEIGERLGNRVCTVALFPID